MCYICLFGEFNQNMPYGLDVSTNKYVIQSYKKMVRSKDRQIWQKRYFQWELSLLRLPGMQRFTSNRFFTSVKRFC